MNKILLLKLIAFIAFVFIGNTCMGEYWVNKETTIKNPWSQKEYPFILELNLNGDSTIGFRQINTSNIRYLKVNKVKDQDTEFTSSGGDMNFSFKIVDDEKLLLYYGKDTIEYIKLHITDQTKHNNENSFVNILERNKWKVEGLEMLFTKDKIPQVTADVYQLLCYGNNKFIGGGIYFLYVFKGNIFLHYMIDGSFERKVYLIRDYSKKEIFYSTLSDQANVSHMKIIK